MRTEMTNVREYAEGYEVVLTDEDSANDNRLTVRALNEGGYNCTHVDLLDLIAWLRANRPDLLVPRA